MAVETLEDKLADESAIIELCYSLADASLRCGSVSEKYPTSALMIENALSQANKIALALLEYLSQYRLDHRHEDIMAYGHSKSAQKFKG
jgi:hypothetical protein